MRVLRLEKSVAEVESREIKCESNHEILFMIALKVSYFNYITKKPVAS